MSKTISVSKSTIKTALLIMSIGLISGLISGNQVFGLSRDYQAYIDFFKRISGYGWESLFRERFEFGFGLTSFLLVLISNSATITYGILSAISFSLKVLSLRIISCGFLAGLFFYTTRFFPLHEMTQLRVAIGSSFAVLSFVLEDLGYRKLSLLMILTGISFHWSVIILIPFVFLYTDKRTLLLALVIALELFLTLKYFSEIILNNAEKLFYTLKIYETIGYGNKINYFSVSILLDASIVFEGLIFWRFNSVIMKKILIAQIFSFALFYGLMDFPVLALRFHDLFAVLMIIYVSSAFESCRFLRISVIVYIVLSSVLYTYVYFVKYQLFA